MSEDINKNLGAKLRERRHLLGISQKQLGKVAGMSFQQVQKYESGANSLSAARLCQFSQILKVPITYFFEESIYDHDKKTKNELTDREFSRMINTYKKIKDLALRKRLLDLMRSMTS